MISKSLSDTVKKYCCEDFSLIENYEEAVKSPEKWECHHRLEIVDGVVTSMNELKEQGLYYNRPCEELIFLKRSEHRSLHYKSNSYYKGRHHTEETKKKLSEIPFTEERRRKLSEARKGRTPNKGKHHSEETKRKIGGAFKGKHWKTIDGKRVWY